MMIKVKATYPKETEVTLKMDLRSSQAVLGVLGNIVGSDHKVEGFSNDEVDNVLLEMRCGLESEGITYVEDCGEYNEDGESL